MSVLLENPFSYPAELLTEAHTLPDGVFIEVDDLAFDENGMGRKTAQTQQVTIHGRTVSMAYLGGPPFAYDLVLHRDHPVMLGTYAELLQQHPDVHRRLLQAFGGPWDFTIHEMVVALVGMTTRGLTNEVDAAAWARRHVRRSAWLLQNRFDALTRAPVTWAALGL